MKNMMVNVIKKKRLINLNDKENVKPRNAMDYSLDQHMLGTRIYKASFSICEAFGNATSVTIPVSKSNTFCGASSSSSFYIRRKIDAVTFGSNISR